MVMGTSIELTVMGWLDKRKITDYEFQTSLGGGLFELGGSVIDFLFRERMLAWRVQGAYWHRGVEKSGSDLIQKERLAAMGLTVVDIWEDDILSRLEETLTKALQGIEVL